MYSFYCSSTMDVTDDVFVEEDEEDSSDEEYMDEEQYQEYQREQAIQMRSVIEQSSSCMWMETAEKKHQRFLIINQAVERTFDHAKLRAVDEDIIPVSYFLSDTYLRNTMQVSPLKVKDFALGKKVGAAAATRLSFLLKTLSSSSIGQCAASQNGDTTATVIARRGGYTCLIGDRVFPKVSLYMEVLVHDEHLELDELYADDNWKGYRLWFMIHDRTIDIDHCIDAQIQANALSLGLVSDFQHINTSGVQAANTIRDYFGGDLKSYRSSVQQENREAARKNKEARERRDFLSSLKIENTSQHYLDIYSRLSYYNQCLVPLNSDGERKTIALGEPLATTLEDAKRFITDPNPPEGQTGRIIMNPIFAEYMHHCNHYGVTTAHYINTLNDAKVCDHQMDNTNYFGADVEFFEVYQLPPAAEGSPPNEWARCLTFEFPLKKLVFRYSQQHMEPEFFMELPLPWVFSPMDVELERFEKRFKEREDQEEAERHSRFFDQFSETERGALVLRALEIDGAHHRAALESTRDPIRLQPKDLEPIDENTHSYLRYRLKKPTNRTSDSDPNIISIESTIDDARRIQHARFKKLRRFWKVMAREEQLDIMDLYQEEGMRLFLNAMTNSVQHSHTHVVKEAIRLAEDLIRRGQSAYHERDSILFRMGFTASYMARELLELEHHEGMLAHHIRVHELRGRAFRAAHDHHTDRLYGTSGAIEHEMVIGAAGTGKTHAVEVATKQLLAGTIYVNNSSSACADNSGESQSDTVMAIDEMDGRFNPGARQTPQDAQQMANIKSSMTGDFSLTRSILALGDSKGKSALESAKERKNLKIKSNMHRSIQIAGNILHTGMEPSFLSRFLVYLISCDDLKRPSRSLTSSLLRAGSSGITAVLDPVRSRLDEWRQLEHALHVFAAKMISVGAIHYPNIEMFNVHWSNVHTAILEVLPSMADISRVSEAMISRALTECINIAIHKVFASEDSPLVEFDSENKRIDEELFSLRQLKLIEPYLFLPEDMAIHIITQFVNTQIFPASWYQLMEMIAVEKCQYATERRREAQAEVLFQSYLKSDRSSENALSRRTEQQLRTQAMMDTLKEFCPRWAHTSKGGGAGQVVDANYVSTDMSKDEVARYIDATSGYNYYCGTYMIDKMCTMRLRAKSLNRDDGDKEIDMPILKLEVPPFSGSGEDERTAKKNSSGFTDLRKVYISVVYLEQFHPEEVMDRVMDTICYNGIRERDVLIGVHPANNWHLWAKRSLRRGKHPLRVPNSTYLSDEVRNIFYEKTPLTRSAQSAFSAASAAREDDILLVAGASSSSTASTTESSDRFLHFDENNCAETALCVKWLIETVGIENPEDAIYYLPHMVDMRIKARHVSVEGYGKEDLKDYPACMIEDNSRCSGGHLSRINRILAGTWRLDSTREKALQPRYNARQLEEGEDTTPKERGDSSPAAAAAAAATVGTFEHYNQCMNKSATTTSSTRSADCISMHGPPSPPYEKPQQQQASMIGTGSSVLVKRHHDRSHSSVDGAEDRYQTTPKTNSAHLTPRSNLYQNLRPEKFF